MQPPVVEFPIQSEGPTEKIAELGLLLKALSELTALIEAKRVEILDLAGDDGNPRRHARRTPSSPR